MTNQITQLGVHAVQNLSDEALAAMSEDAIGTVSRLRAKYPQWKLEKLERHLLRVYRKSVTATGLLAGAAATLDVLDEAAAAGDGTWFVRESAKLIFELAALHEVDVEDVKQQRDLLLAVLGVAATAGVASTVAGRTGKHLGRRATRAIPASSLKAANKVLGRNTVTKYGKTGAVQLGVLLPAGIGAVLGGVGNNVASRAVIVAVLKSIREFEPTAEAPTNPQTQTTS